MTRHSSVSVARQSGMCISRRTLTVTSKRAIAERQVLRVAAEQADRRGRAGHPRLADAQHLARVVDAGDAAAARGQGQRRARRAGADVEHGGAGDVADERGDHARFLRRRRARRSGRRTAARRRPRRRPRPRSVRRCSGAGFTRRPAPPGPRRSRRARRRRGACARGRPRSCISCRPGRGRAGRWRRPRPGRRRRARMPAAYASGVASVRTATESSSTCVCVSSRVAMIGRPARRYW